MTSRGRQRGWKVAVHLMLLPFLLFALFPFYHMTLTSLKQDRELYDRQASPLVIRQGATLQHYTKLLWESAFLTWTKNSLLVTILDAGTRGFDSKLGLDMHIAASAKAANKSTGGLETGLQQLDMLDGMDKDQQLQMLDETLSDSGDERELDMLHREWRAGDADDLAAHMVNEVRTKYPAMYQRINTERNDTWVPKLEARLAAPGTDDTLVVVGAMHLLGSDGVVEKLRRKGYKVERVCSACAVK